MLKEYNEGIKSLKKWKVRVKTKKIQGNLEVFREKERVEYEIVYVGGKVKVKIKLKEVKVRITDLGSK